jgi:hypothetical protein
MYCSTCGVAVAQGLSYCNYCGEKLSGAKSNSVSKPREVKPELLVSSMVALFIFGLFAITLLMGMMKAVLNVNVGVVLGFGLMSFLMMLGIEGVLIGLLMGGKRGVRESGVEDLRLKQQTTRELDAAQARALPEPVPSVTEHTTRAFDPVYNERTAK